MVDRSAYKVGVVVSIGDCGSKSSLRVCEVNVGDENNPVTVVTAAKNVREGSRLVPSFREYGVHSFRRKGWYYQVSRD